LFNAQIDWLKATYTFSPRSLVRATAQRKTIERNGTTDRKTTFSGLYAYKLNWQTVFFVGYGDAEDARSVFMKVAYAFQR
jgi:predicted porin